MKKSFGYLALLALIFVSAPALACSLTRTMRVFVPNQQDFERKHDFPIALVVPAPVVKVVSVKRATSDMPGNCNMYTFVDLDVSIPEGSVFKLSELGFVFRAEPDKPQDPLIAFPNFPVTSLSVSPDGKGAHFNFGLRDPVSTRSQPFKIKLDVLAINDGLQISQSTTVIVTHP